MQITSIYSLIHKQCNIFAVSNDNARDISHLTDDQTSFELNACCAEAEPVENGKDESLFTIWQLYDQFYLYDFRDVKTCRLVSNDPSRSVIRNDVTIQLRMD